MESPATDFVGRLDKFNTLPNGAVRGIVVSDTHVGAPYADLLLTDVYLEQKLDIARDVKFCVMLGDIYEVVNLAVKHLPQTQEEAIALRKEMIFDYIGKKHILLDDGMKHELKNSMQYVSEDHMNSLLGFEPGSRGQDNIRNIFRKTRPRYDVETEMIKLHMGHLTKLVNDHPGCTFYYVVGNHERMPEFLHALDATRRNINEKAGAERLVVTEKHFTFGDALFVHGDQQMTPSKYKIDEPDKFTESEIESNRSRFMQLVHDRLNKRIPRIVGEILHRPEQCADKVLSWFEQNDPATLECVNHVFMGHTHFPFTNVKVIHGMTGHGQSVTYCAHPGETVEGNPRLLSGTEYTFHNTGAALDRMGIINKDAFNPLEIILTPPAKPHASIGPDTFYAGYTTHAVNRNQQPALQRA